MSSKRNTPPRTSERKPKSPPPLTTKTSPTTTTRTSSIFPLLLITLLSLSLIPPTQAYTPLSETSLSQLFSSPLSDTHSNFHPTTGTLLSPILIPRVPGTAGSETVQRHFVDFFARELPEWTLEWQNSTSTTPATGEKMVEFRNLIFRRDPPWLVGRAKDGDGDGDAGKFIKRLTLAAHYDSLYRPEGFIGAIDSAAPCAMLMAVARNVDGALGRRWEAMMREREGDSDGLEDFDENGEGGEEEGVQIVFLDGEEAWVEWTDEDSLYGSRALAEEWEGREYAAAGEKRKKTELDGISLFVLLDLLGGAGPQVPSFFGDTHWAYQHLALAEASLRKMGLLGSRPEKGAFFQEGKKTGSMFTGGYVLDDHVPFLQRGVPVLHVIPLPFPKVWHTMEDDGEHLDVATVGDWARIVSVFVAEWMDVEGFVVDGGVGEEGVRERDEL